MIAVTCWQRTQQVHIIGKCTYNLFHAGAHFTLGGGSQLIGGALAFVSALVAIALMMRWLRHASYMPFIVYRVALGILLLALIYGFGWSPVHPA